MSLTVDTVNHRLIAARGDAVVAMLPIPQEMSADEARNVAAWLGVLADAIDPEGVSFDDVVEAVRAT